MYVAFLGKQQQADAPLTFFQKAAADRLSWEYADANLTRHLRLFKSSCSQPRWNGAGSLRCWLAVQILVYVSGRMQNQKRTEEALLSAHAMEVPAGCTRIVYLVDPVRWVLPPTTLPHCDATSQGPLQAVLG